MQINVTTITLCRFGMRAARPQVSRDQSAPAFPRHAIHTFAGVAGISMRGGRTLTSKSGHLWVNEASQFRLDLYPFGA